MRVGVDLDSVLANLSGAALRVWNEQHPSQPMTRADWTIWKMGDRLGISQTSFHRLLDDSWHQWSKMGFEEPTVRESLLALHKVGHLVHIITNRTRQTHLDVLAWLHHHDFYYDTLTFNHKGPPKLEFPIDVLIDDNPHEAERVPDGKLLYLRSHPWNREVSTSGKIQRVRTLAEAVLRIG